MDRNLSLIGYRCGLGAQIQECYKGPKSLKRWDIVTKFMDAGIQAYWDKVPEIRANPENFELYTEESCHKLYRQVRETLKKGDFPVTIGGDHSMAMGTWSGVVDHYDLKRKFGLIWIDAHLDAHTPETSASHAMHGMPAAHLLGYGSENFVNIGTEGAKISPNHLVYIGVRSYESEEHALIKGLGIRVYYMDEVRDRGFNVVMNEALEYVKKYTDAFGLTIDLDAFDPERAPGVGTPEADGLCRQEFFPVIKKLGLDKQLKAVEIAEFNPDRDENDRTKRLILQLITCLFQK